jgi:uroporphyrinogen decarboxylase
MITDSTIAYLKAQIAAGVNIVQLFDSWAGILSPAQYATFSLPYISRICSAIQEVPKIVFPKGAFFARAAFAEVDCQVIGLDWNMDIAESRKLIGAGKALQGNLDPCILFAPPEIVRQETIHMLKSFGSRHIANLGHGVYPDTPLDNVKLFVDTVKNFAY